MTLCFALGILWLVGAQLIPALPAGRQQRGAIWLMTLIGIPLVGAITWRAGPIWGMLFLAAGAISLRWPLPSLRRGLRRDSE